MPQKGFLRSSELVQQARPPIFFGVVVGIDLGCENDAVARWRWLAPPGELREQHPSTGDFSTGVTGCTAVARFLREESLHKAIERSAKDATSDATAEGNQGEKARPH